MRKKIGIFAPGLALVLVLFSLLVWAQRVVISPEDKAVAESEIDNAKRAIGKASEKLQVAKEKCCLKPEVGGCSMCLIMLGGDCTCRQSLLAGKAVCPECGFRWLEGKGLAPDKIKLSQVKTLVDDMRKEKGVTLEK
jgi:hypothetical protein